MLGLVSMSSADLAFTAWVVILASQTDINTSQLQNGNYSMENVGVPLSRLQTDKFSLPNRGRPYYYPSELRPKVREGLENKTVDHKCVDYSIKKEAVNNYRGANITLDKVSLNAKDGFFCEGRRVGAISGYAPVFDTIHVTEEPLTYIKYNSKTLITLFSIIGILVLLGHRHRN
jgi:hypothetical protein